MTLKRLSGSLLRSASTLVVVLVLSFFLTRIAYRNPAAMLAPRNATQEGIEAVARALRLNDPWYEQLFYYLFRGAGHTRRADGADALAACARLLLSASNLLLPTSSFRRPPSRCLSRWALS